VGAFREEESAKRLIAKLREQNFKVEQAVRHGSSEPVPPAAAAAPTPLERPTAPAGGDQYDVFVSGMSATDLNRRLSAKGLAAEATAGGLVIRPSLPLRDAVALSKDLAVEGFKVQVRRAGSTEAARAAPRPTPMPSASTSGGGETLYRVRVGSFPDRAAAVIALRELEGKGYKGYIARGEQ
jgi:hypothetical protein